jgi:hypothetical protein
MLPAGNDHEEVTSYNRVGRGRALMADNDVPAHLFEWEVHTCALRDFSGPCP